MTGRTDRSGHRTTVDNRYVPVESLWNPYGKVPVPLESLRKSACPFGIPPPVEPRGQLANRRIAAARNIVEDPADRLADLRRGLRDSCHVPV